MVERDAGDDRYQGADDVGRIEPAAHADLEHDRAGPLLGEVQQTHRRGDLEERQPAFVLAKDVAFEPFDGVAQLVHQRDHLGRRRRLAVDRESLLQAVQVRRGIEPCPHTRSTERRGRHRGGRTLALGARDVDDRQPGMRVAQPAEQPPHPPELQTRRGFEYMSWRLLVVEPAVQVFEAFLIVGQHDGSLAYDSLPGRISGDRDDERSRAGTSTPIAPRLDRAAALAAFPLCDSHRFGRVSPGAPAGSARGPSAVWIRAHELDRAKDPWSSSRPLPGRNPPAARLRPY